MLIVLLATSAGCGGSSQAGPTSATCALAWKAYLKLDATAREGKVRSDRLGRKTVEQCTRPLWIRTARQEIKRQAEKSSLAPPADLGSQLLDYFCETTHPDPPTACRAGTSN